MKTTVYFADFRDAFLKIRPDNFSRGGIRVLFDYFEEVEDSCGIECELDVIATCCEFSESTWQNIAADYSIDIDENENDDEQKAAVLDYLADEGALVGETDAGSIVYRNF